MVGILTQDQASSHQTRLQRIVLGWDYFQLYAEAQASAEKKRKRGIVTDGEDGGLVEVPLTFEDMDSYQGIFEPLLLEECQAQILRGREDSGAVGDPQVGAATKCEKSNEFYFAVVVAPPEVVASFNENDLLLISKEKPLGGTALPSTYSLALVESRETKTSLRLRMCLGGDEASEPIGGWTTTQRARANRMRTMLVNTTDTPCWLLNLCNLSTITREYAALRAAPSLPFAHTILKATIPEKDKKSAEQWNLPPGLLTSLEANHNDSQMQAIQAGLSRTPLVLIQGPPGTGKTQTILGLLTTVLHSRPERQRASSEGSIVVAHRKEVSFLTKVESWRAASPWMAAGNPRDLAFPEDDGAGEFFGGGHYVETLGTTRTHRAHVLVCAPSNAALDEIVLRLIHTGLRDEKGFLYSPTVVRVGLNAHHSVASVSMDNLVTQRLSSMERSAVSAGAKGSVGMERDRIRLAILDDAEIVCSTLAFSGSGVFSRMSRGFDTVVIDEAAQAVEPSTLVPLCHGARQAFLVGDPLQLPATVLSTKAVNYGYSESMFKRLQEAGYPVHMLRTQYRMHSQIREFPSREFYNNELQDAPGVDELTRRPWHDDRIFGPLFFFDVVDGKEEQPGGSGSYVNTLETEFVVQLYRSMVQLYPQLKQSSKVGIISPYKMQVKLIKQQLRELEGTDITERVDINTIDGFQGREKDVAIFSCVRANKDRGIGFVADYRRMNVGLTRARASMLVVGNSAALMQDKHWRNLVRYARKIKRYLRVPAKAQWAKLFKEEYLAQMRQVTEEERKRLEETGGAGTGGADDDAVGMMDDTVEEQEMSAKVRGAIDEAANMGDVELEPDEDEEEEEEEEAEGEEEQEYLAEDGKNYGGYDEDPNMGDDDG